MAQYEASVPEDGSLKPGIASFFEAFYAISDTADAHEQYADQFTSNAKLIMGPKETSGRQGMLPSMDFSRQQKLIQKFQVSLKCVKACGRRSLSDRTSLRRSTRLARILMMLCSTAL